MYVKKIFSVLEMYVKKLFDNNNKKNNNGANNNFMSSCIFLKKILSVNINSLNAKITII